MKSDNLFLILKKKWYDLIDQGIKTEEYREIKTYWIKRLCKINVELPFVYCKLENCCLECFHDDKSGFEIRDYKTVTFQLGYKKNAPRMSFHIKEIRVDCGQQEWGAEPQQKYFVIRLDERIPNYH